MENGAGSVRACLRRNAGGGATRAAPGLREVAEPAWVPIASGWSRATGGASAATTNRPRSEVVANTVAHPQRRQRVQAGCNPINHLAACLLRASSCEPTKLGQDVRLLELGREPLRAR